MLSVPTQTPQHTKILTPAAGQLMQFFQLDGGQREGHFARLLDFPPLASSPYTLHGRI